MANEKNLINFSQRTESEQREIAQKGGIASGASRKKKASIKKTLSTLLTESVKKYPALSTIAGKYGLPDTATVEKLITVGVMLKAAVDGSAGELLKIMEIIGEQTKETPEEAASGHNITFVFSDTSVKAGDENG